MSKDTILLLLISFLAVFAWFSFEVYHRQQAVYVSQEVIKLSEEINPQLDTDTLKLLKQFQQN